MNSTKIRVNLAVNRALLAMTHGFSPVVSNQNLSELKGNKMSKLIATLVAGLFVAATAIAADMPKAAAPAAAPAAAAPAAAPEAPMAEAPKKMKKHHHRKAKKAAMPAAEAMPAK